jgi:hypothetical protein
MSHSSNSPNGFTTESAVWRTLIGEALFLLAFHEKCGL